MGEGSNLGNLEAEALGIRDHTEALGVDVHSSWGRSHRWVQHVMTLPVKREDERVVLRIGQLLLFRSHFLESGIVPSTQEWGALESVVHVHASHNRLEEAYFPVVVVAEDHEEGDVDMDMGIQHTGYCDEEVEDREEAEDHEEVDMDTLHKVQGNVAVVLHLLGPPSSLHEPAFPFY